MIPLNYLRGELKADYINTGNWAEKAYKEAKLVGGEENVKCAGTSKEVKFARLPRPDPVHQMEEVRDTARKLLAQAYLAGLRYPGVLQVLEQADRALSAPASEEEKV